MDVSEYISSGLLESYVLGLTSKEENSLIQKLIKEYPQVNDEILAIETALLTHASHQATALPLHIKDVVIKKTVVERESKIIDHPASLSNKYTNNSLRYLAAASVILFFISSFANFYFYSNWRNAEERITALNIQNDQLAEGFSIEQTKYKSIESNMAIMQSPYNKQVMMKGLPVAPGALAMVYWNQQTHEVFINVHQLPAPHAGQQYQLWALADGKPVDAGVFNVNDTSLQKMKNITNAQAFAVTLEKEGGSPVPTLTALYLMGNL